MPFKVQINEWDDIGCIVTMTLFIMMQMFHHDNQNDGENTSSGLWDDIHRVKVGKKEIFFLHLQKTLSCHNLQLFRSSTCILWVLKYKIHILLNQSSERDCNLFTGIPVFMEWLGKVQNIAVLLVCKQLQLWQGERHQWLFDSVWISVHGGKQN